MTGRQVIVGGRRVFVAVDGAGPPVLVLNGIGAHHAMLGPLVAGLHEFTTIAFDAPGVGRSPFSEPLSIPALSCLAVDLLDVLGHDRVDVIGYSFGGTVAQELARGHGDRVRRLVLVGTGCGWGGLPGNALALLALATPLRYYSRAYFEATLPLLVRGPREVLPHVVHDSGSARRAYPPNLCGYMGQLSALATWTSLHWLHEIGHPTLVIAGGLDPVVPAANGALLAARLPNARLHLDPEEGHFSLVDAESASISAIEEFLMSPDHEMSDTWAKAVAVDDRQLQEAIRSAPGLATPLVLINDAVRFVSELARPSFSRSRG